MASEAASPTMDGGMKKLLATYFIGEMRISVAKLVLTTIGREHRESGVLALKETILNEGFLDQFAPIACLSKPLDAGQTLAEAAAVEGFTLTCLDGNHRVLAVKMIDEEKKSEQPTSIMVRVHQPMPPSTARMVAAGGFLTAVLYILYIYVFCCGYGS